MKPRPTCCVAVVDDLPLYRQGIINALNSVSYAEVVEEGSTSDDAVRIAREKRPDILIFDIEKSAHRGELISRILTASQATRLIVLTRCENEEDIDACLEAGVRGYVLKGASADELVRVVNSVHEGQSYVTPQLAARLLSRNSRAKIKQISDLSLREEAVIVHVSQGLTNKEIARNLCVSEKTIKHHMTKVMQKLQVRSRIQAALYVRDRAAAVAS